MLWSVKMDPNLNDYHMMVPQMSVEYEELAWGMNEYYWTLHVELFYRHFVFVMFSFPFSLFSTFYFYGLSVTCSSTLQQTLINQNTIEVRNSLGFACGWPIVKYKNSKKKKKKEQMCRVLKSKLINRFKIIFTDSSAANALKTSTASLASQLCRYLLGSRLAGAKWIHLYRLVLSQ